MTVREIMGVIQLRDHQMVETIDYRNRQTYRSAFGYSFAVDTPEKEALMMRTVRMMYFSGSVLTLILKEDGGK